MIKLEVFFDHCPSVFESKTTQLSELKAAIQSGPALLLVQGQASVEKQQNYQAR